jgi:hypothetical protein
LTRLLNLSFSIPSERNQKTDYNRIYKELIDLPFKPGYKKLFKVKVDSANPKDLIFPTLYINFKGKFYPFRLILVGYPYYIDGFFLVLPLINGSTHPHVLPSGHMCWDLEKEWKPGMTLYEDYIRFLLKTLYKPEV